MIQKHFACLLALALTLFVGASVNAQDPNHQLSLTDAMGGPGANVDSMVMYTNTSPDDIAGWSYGVAHDNTLLTLVDVVDGATTATVNGGSPPDFNQINLLADGWTVGAVISFLGNNPLPPGADYELNIATYTIDMANPGDTAALDFSNDLGAPPVATVVVVAGASVVPETTGATIEVMDVPPPFTYFAGDTTETVLLGGSVDIMCMIDEEGTLSDTQGFSMGLAHDGLIMAATGIVSQLPFDPDFFGDNVIADEGWTVGVVYSFTGGTFLQFADPTAVVLASYDNIGGAEGDTTPLTWVDTLGEPPVANVVVVAGQSVDVNFADGLITLIDVPPLAEFLRGDANYDGIVNIADGITIIGRFWYGYMAGPCPAADDANADGILDTSDAVYIFNYRFLEGPPPPAPFPACGESDEGEEWNLLCQGICL